MSKFKDGYVGYAYYVAKGTWGSMQSYMKTFDDSEAMNKFAYRKEEDGSVVSDVVDTGICPKDKVKEKQAELDKCYDYLFTGESTCANTRLGKLFAKYENHYVKKA